MKTLFIFGTRPEAIKLTPLVKEIQKNNDDFENRVCVTAQHRGMLDQVLDFFQIKPDYDLDIMKQGQSLIDVTVNSLKGLQKVLDDYSPDLLFVQGDTTTVLTGALAGFYYRIKVAHIEAGLRSGNIYSPFPEEVNRILASHLSEYHFAPTERAKKNLSNEGINKNVWVVGNTVIDALFMGLEIIKKHDKGLYVNHFDFIDFSNRIILVTGHRRESFGKPFEEICYSLKEIAETNNNVEIVYPVHLNPNVREPVNRILSGIEKIHLIEPLDYPHLIWLMNKSYFVLTDSGGIQEEAPSLGKPVLVMRDVTERIEGIDAGTALLVGTEKQKIVNESLKLLNNKKAYDSMAKAINPYGDGTSSKKIVQIINKTQHLLH
ncbi:MAG: UDP-N-acetylglucosamine 2-epimerase (non-hydrolyzing) [Spirochaetota bacterium]|nr:UDP-N-acetylglucosamine 2-epimerase (non-hydrolyzing) [Spirochaetota bacterium]